MAFLNITNRAGSSLPAGIDNVQTSFDVASGQGALFPASNFIITIEGERILVGTRTTDTFSSCTRGYDGTTAVAHIDGKVVELRIIAKHITELQDFANTKGQASGLASLDVSSLVVQNPANATATPTASKIPIADVNGKLNNWIINPDIGVATGTSLNLTGLTASQLVKTDASKNLISGATISDSELSNIAFNKIIQAGKVLRLISFDSYDMISTVVVGSGTIVQIFGIANVKTGTTGNSYARQNFNTQAGMGLYSGDLIGWYVYRGSLTGDTVGFIGGIRDTLLTTEVNHTLTAKHAGLFYDNGVFYTSSGDGTSQQLTDVTASLGSSTQNWFKIYFDGSSVYFYWGDILIATHTIYAVTSLYQQIWISNKANAIDSTIQIYNFYRKGIA